MKYVRSIGTKRAKLHSAKHIAHTHIYRPWKTVQISWRHRLSFYRSSFAQIDHIQHSLQLAEQSQFTTNESTHCKSIEIFEKDINKVHIGYGRHYMSKFQNATTHFKEKRNGGNVVQRLCFDFDTLICYGSKQNWNGFQTEKRLIFTRVDFFFFFMSFLFDTTIGKF